MITITYMPERVAQKDLMHLGTEFAKFDEPSRIFGVRSGGKGYLYLDDRPLTFSKIVFQPEP
jgi:hypothetical protein